MKKPLSLLCFILLSIFIQAQVMYTTTAGGGVNGKGTISRFVPETHTFSSVFTFEYPNVTSPNGAKMLEASDGKLYGIVAGNSVGDFGGIFSFNPETSDYIRLFDFDGSNGGNPEAGLIQANDGKLYGVTASGGDSNNGVIFCFDPISSTYTRLMSFDGTNGKFPMGALLQASNGKFYGMTNRGGSNDYGVVFSFDPKTSTYTKIKDFNMVNGAHPYGSMIQASDGMLYGMTYEGGSNGLGVIFYVDPAAGKYSTIRNLNNTSGGFATGSLMQATDGKLYGMTQTGANNNGTSTGAIFSFVPSTKMLEALYYFDGSNGGSPHGSLVQAKDGSFYGTTHRGGNKDLGVLFSFMPVKRIYTPLVYFDSTNGSLPQGSLTLASDGKLYATTLIGGKSNKGVLFSYSPSSTAYTKIKDFGPNNTGAGVVNGIVNGVGGKFYGMTLGGGSHDNGVLFSYDTLTATYNKILNFNGTNGSSPLSSLTKANDGKLYGTTNVGGSEFAGVLFCFDPASSVFTKLKDFKDPGGSYPRGSLLLGSDEKLYGTAQGGQYGWGVLFSYAPTTSTYTKLFDFENKNGGSPNGSLAQAKNGILYGLSNTGGDHGSGVIYSFDPSTNAYTKLFAFGGSFRPGPNSNLILANDNKLYGVANGGESNNLSFIYSFDLATSTYNTVLNIEGTAGGSEFASVMQSSDGKIYGMLYQRGAYGTGILFSFDPATATYTKLVDLHAPTGINPVYSALTEVTCTTMRAYYKDADGDSYGNMKDSLVVCTAPAGYVANNLDCNDADNTVYPGASELCDGKDNNCNGSVDENCPKIKINDVSQTEGNSSTKKLVFTISLSKASTDTVQVHFKTVDGTALSPVDYTAKSGILTFVPGITKRNITIRIKGDATYEEDETFQLVLSNPVNATITDISGIATILNDDGSTLNKYLPEQDTLHTVSVIASPNPANTIINIRMSGVNGNIKLQITDIQGKVIKESKLQAVGKNVTQHQLNVGGIAGGTYIIVITNDQGIRISKRIIIVH